MNIKALTKKKQKPIITGLIFAVIVIGMLFVQHSAIVKFTDTIDFSASGGVDVTVTFTAFYEGDIVHTSILYSPYALVKGDVPIDPYSVLIEWSSYGTYIDWDSLFITGKMTTWKLNYVGAPVQDLTNPLHTIFKSGATAQNGSTSFGIVLVNVLDGISMSGSDDGVGYWDLQWKITLDGHVDDIYGNELTDSIDITHTKRFWDAAGTFGFDP